MTNITIKDTRLMKELEKLALHEDGWSFHIFLHISLIICIYIFLFKLTPLKVLHKMFL